MSPHCSNDTLIAGIDDDRSSILEHLKQIVELLQTSTIAEESGKDTLSRFWAAYKKFSGKYDDNMLERYNSSMDILLIFVRQIFLVAMPYPTRFMLSRLVCSPPSIPHSSSQCSQILAILPMPFCDNSSKSRQTVRPPPRQHSLNLPLPLSGHR